VHEWASAGGHQVITASGAARLRFGVNGSNPVSISADSRSGPARQPDPAVRASGSKKVRLAAIQGTTEPGYPAGTVIWIGMIEPFASHCTWCSHIGFWARFLLTGYLGVQLRLTCV
jgi:hypothetical protein